MKSIWNNETMNYANQCESKCDTYFNFLVQKTKWFSTISKNEMNNKIDYKFTTNKGKQGVAELKIRKINVNEYADIMIEADKLKALYNAYNEDNEVLYINWFNNNINKVWICKIKDIINEDLRFSGDVKIKSELGNKYTYSGERYYIPVSKGSYFEYDQEKNKYIRK